MSDELRASVRFAVVPEWVLNHERLSDRAVRLYGVLARFADTNGVAWPSRATLAARLWCSRDSVDRAVRELTEVGALTKQKRYNDSGDFTSNLYVLHPGGNQQTFPMGSSQPSAPVRGGGRTAAPTPGRTAAGTGSRTVAAQNDTHSEGESFESEPLLEESAPVPTDNLPAFLRQRILGEVVPIFVAKKENQ